MKRFVFLVLLSFMAGVADAQQPAIDSLLNVLNSHKEDSNKAKAYTHVIYQYLHTDVKKARKYTEELLAFSRKIGYDRGIVDANGYMGEYYRGINDWETAMQWYSKADSLAVKINYSRSRAGNASFFASYYTYKGNYEQALLKYQETLKYYRRTNEKRGEGVTLGAIANLFVRLERYAEAETYYLRSLAIREETGDLRGMSNMYVNLGALLMETEQYEKALFYFRKCLSIQENLNEIVTIAIAQANIGNIYTKMGEYDKALTMLNESYRNQAALMDTANMAYCLLYESIVYREMGDYRMALDTLDRGFAMVENAQSSPQELADFHVEYYHTHKQAGNYKEALESYEKALELNEAVFSTEMAAKISELREKFDTEQKESENLDLRQQAEIRALEISRKQYVIYFLGALLLLIAAVSVLFIRQSQALYRQRTAVLEQRLLRNQMNPHFMFNALIAIQSFVYKSEPKEAGKYISSFARLMRAILDNSRQEYIPLEKEIQWLENYIQLQLLRFDNKFTYEIIMGENIETGTVIIPPMLTQPFIENALEHGIKEIDYVGNITVSFLQEADHLIVEVRDNGIGVGNQEQKKASDHMSHATTITRERLALLNRRKSRKIHFTVTPLEPTGTMVRFSIPMR